MVGQREMRRHQNWPQELAAIIERRKDDEFKYGAHDCGLFVADCVLAMTGIDIADGVREAYQSKADLTELFGEDWIIRMDVIFEGILKDHFTTVPVARARRGDIVLHRGEVFSSLGICAGEVSWFTGPAGLVTINTLSCKRAWRV